MSITISHGICSNYKISVISIVAKVTDTANVMVVFTYIYTRRKC